MKLLPILVSLIQAYYLTSKAGDLQDSYIGAEALTWYFITILQIIILIIYEILKRLTIYFTDRKLQD